MNILIVKQYFYIINQKLNSIFITNFNILLIQKMGAGTFGIPKELVLNLQKIFNIEIFVETGTFKGGTTSWDARYFNKVITIENSTELFDSARKYLSKFNNIQCVFGNSGIKLNEVIKQLDKPAIFWLDAHWCGGLTFGSDYECPLIEEIAYVCNDNKEHIIIIDDARYFIKPPKGVHSTVQWPGLNEIIPALMRNNGYYTFVCEDVIVSLPERGKDLLQPYFNAIHDHEFPGGGILSNLIFAYRNIKKKWMNNY